MKKVFNKLVRDRIPQIIEANGEKAEIEILDEERFLQELHKKLFEEANEFAEEDSPEELADLMEVIYAIARLRGIDLEEVEKIRQQKAQKRGAFDKRIFLKETN
ncbi:MAG: nucleoside triphosphate pyrophosphohydrolase [Clostridia bacterium]|nr:nucleoside triphosphate pyrophosphohydrolase [Clostridia bacterium]